ncbi:MAG TPA: isoprenylcysteine carboxylmethyltransferase family protein [Flavobacteriales bacterium]|nr:isoprenylcysteine carboxylmethyltransferase family protein [Flavobacteriales bacterium]
MDHLPSPQYFFLVFAFSEVGLLLFKRSKGGAQAADRGSLRALWLVIGVSIYAAIDSAYRWPQFAFASNSVVYAIAVALFLSGLGLRWWSIIHLGRFFTVNVAIAEDHRIVDDGPYRLLRHPSYTGALLGFCGLALMLQNGLSAVLLLVPITVMFLWRIAIEERALTAAFGPAYEAYKARTKRLVPFVY